MKHLTWKQLTSLEVGGAICLPVIMVGQALCNTYGVSSAILAILVGNAILLLMALATCHMSVNRRLATADNAYAFFGVSGSKLFACALLIAKCCWFGIQLDMIAISMQSILPTGISQTVIQIGMGAIISGVALCGIRALSTLSSLCMPVLIGTMVYAVYAAIDTEAPAREMPLSYEGISIAIATAITAVIDMPTYFRHAKSMRDGLVAVVIMFFVALPLIEGLGVYLCYKNPASNVVETLQNAQSHLWNLWISLFLVLAGWTTNNTNLYSAVACLGTMIPKISDKKRTLLVGTLATCLSLLHILNYFGTVLQLLGVMVGSMGSVILVRYLLQKRMETIIPEKIQQNLNLAVWGMGVLIGFASISKIIVLTHIPLLDACLSSSLITLACPLLCKLPVINNHYAKEIV